MVMSNKAFVERIKKNEAGFTFIELMIASVMSLVILGLLAHVFRAQQKEFGQQTGLNTLQANGRAATEFIARSVQNAGFNVQRGSRFLSASDHSLTAVYDENNDNVIQNNEVITYTIANAWDTTVGDNFSFIARYDVDGDGVIQSTENPTINVQMTTTAPPFNLYKVVPNQAGTAIERSLVARNIDNMTIRYYDRNGRLLPVMKDTDNDGVGDVAFDADVDGVPDDGNWTFQFPLSELKDIRKVEIEVLARSRKVSPRDLTSSGSYLQGSLAAVTSGSTSYEDKFMREDFTAQMAPRNLIMAPWGNVAMVANPPLVPCANPSESTVTATLLDANGEAITGSNIGFTATGGEVTVGTPVIASSDPEGEGATLITYDNSKPTFATTVSASALVDDGSGNFKPIYSALPVGYAYTTQGGFLDPFDGTQTAAWADVIPGVGFVTAGGVGLEHFKPSVDGNEALTPALSIGSLNGCQYWQDYMVQTNIEHSTPFANNDHYGIILRYQDVGNYYWARVRKVATFHLGKGMSICRWVF
jgi:Tfp pilus assembly protein PilE